MNETKDHITIDGVEYPLENGCFDLIDHEDPYEFHLGEELIIFDLLHQLQNSERFKNHIDFLVKEGSLYTTYNNNLLFHGCIPCDEEGNFLEIELHGKKYSGKSLMDFYYEAIQKSHAEPNVHDDFSSDLIWYLWCGEISSLFGKKTMKTFERYFIPDKGTHHEEQNIYYTLRDDETFCIKVLEEFGLTSDGYIINGHTPVKTLLGENPVKANGKLLVIDGGLSKAYQKETGIAGYTLIDNSHEIYLVAHHPFTSKEESIKHFKDILPEQKVVSKRLYRQKVLNTDIGKKLGVEVAQLREKWDMNATSIKNRNFID